MKGYLASRMCPDGRPWAELMKTITAQCSGHLCGSVANYFMAVPGSLLVNICQVSDDELDVEMRKRS